MLRSVALVVSFLISNFNFAQADTKLCSSVLAKARSYRPLSQWKEGNSWDSISDRPEVRIDREKIEKLFDKPDLTSEERERIFEEEYEQPIKKQNDYYKSIEQALSKKEFSTVLAHVKSLGVEAQLYSYKRFPWSIFKRKAVQILPGQQTEINRLAQKIQDLYGYKMIIAPSRGSQAWAQTSNKLIGVSDYTALTGKPDLALLHEMKHMALSRKEARGQFDFTFGYLLNFFSAMKPRFAGSIYNFFLSFQEIRAWSQQTNYFLAQVRQSSSFERKSELARKLTSIVESFEDVYKIFNKAEMAALYAIGNIKADKGIKISGGTENHLMAFLDYEWTGLYFHVIPHSFLKTLDQRHKEGTLTVDISTLGTISQPISALLQSANRSTLRDLRRQIAIWFLKDFANELDLEKSQLRIMEKRLTSLTKAIKATTKEDSNWQKVNELLRAIDREGFDDLYTEFIKFDGNTDRLGKLPLSGLPDSKLQSPDFHSAKYSVEPSDDISVNYNSVWDIQRRYLKSVPDEFTDLQTKMKVTKNGKIFELVLEYSMTSDSFFDYLPLLKQEGLTVLEIQFVSIKIEARYEAEYQNVSVKDSDEAHARNFYRIQQILKAASDFPASK